MTLSEKYLEIDKFINISDIDYRVLDRNINNFSYYLYNRDTIGQLDQGSYFLFEEKIGNNIVYPRIGIYLHTILNSAFGNTIEYCRYRRLYEYSKCLPNGTIMAECNSIINAKDITHDNFFIYGIWNNLPDWKTLLEAYRKTLYFHRTIEEVRDLKIKNILN